MPDSSSIPPIYLSRRARLRVYAADERRRLLGQLAANEQEIEHTYRHLAALARELAQLDGQQVVDRLGPWPDRGAAR